MISPSGLTREDWWLIRAPLLCLVLALALIAGLFVAVYRMETGATAELRTIRAQLNSARDDVDKIEQEEAAILENIGRYQELAADAVVRPEDRLLLLESLAQLRARHSLFPIDVSIEGQKTLPLQYPPSSRAPGRPVELHASTINFNLPLLHEDDMARLLTDLLAAPGLFQPQSCQLSGRGTPGTNYLQLAQHFNASCSLLWYTIASQSDTTEAP